MDLTGHLAPNFHIFVDSHIPAEAGRRPLCAEDLPPNFPWRCSLRRFDRVLLVGCHHSLRVRSSRVSCPETPVGLDCKCGWRPVSPVFLAGGLQSPPPAVSPEAPAGPRANAAGCDGRICLADGGGAKPPLPGKAQL